MNRIKLIAFDIDGTITVDNTLTENIKNTFKKLKEKGIYTIPITGRSIESVIPLLKELEIEDSLGVYTTGALIQKSNCDIVCKNTLTIKDYEYIKQNLDEKYFLSIYGIEKLYSEKEPIFEFLDDAKNLAMDVEKVNIDKIKDKDIVRINIMGPKESLDEFEEKEDKDFLEKYYTVRTIPTSYEILSKNASKANGLKKIMEILNLHSKEVLVIGDGNNDVSMFELVENSIAMGNASDFVKSKAKYITKTVFEDGFSYIIDKLLELN